MKRAQASSCSGRARHDGIALAGTAGAADRYLLVEAPPPWPSDICDAPWAAGVPEPAVNVHAICPVDGPGSAATAVLMAFVRSDVQPLRRYEVRVDEGARGPWARQLAVEPIDGAGIGPSDDGRDVLVCTHGTRDRCCGRLGMALALELDRWAKDRAPHVRIWRASHLGGHRFAPTMVDLPSGRCWGHLDPDRAIAVLENRIDPDTIARHYRGSWTWGSAAEQVVEAESWRRLGARWPDMRIEERAVDAGPDRGAVSVAIGARDPQTRARIDVNAEVVERRSVQQVSCSKPPREESSFELLSFRIDRSDRGAG
jgi:hypothetical protein